MYIFSLKLHLTELATENFTMYNKIINDKINNFK